MMENKGVSIIMCCHNSSSLLHNSLKHLAKLDHPENLPVELIIVDNASTDDTAEVAIAKWKEFDQPFPIKILTEKTPGLIHARKTGIINSSYAYLVFVDDDNWLSSDYLIHVTKCFENLPQLAAVGGMNEAVFQTEKPSWFDDFKHSYAVGHLNDSPTEPKEIALFGAGLSIRRKAYEQLVADGFKSQLTGRSGNILSSGEDYELVKALKIAGWEILYNPNLKLDHFITANRLEWTYLKKLNIGISKSIPIFLAYEYWISKQKSPENILIDLRFSWFYLWIKKSIKKKLLGVLLFLFPKYRGEGSKVVIEYERTKTVANYLWRNKRHFNKLKRSIGTSGWIKTEK